MCECAVCVHFHTELYDTKKEASACGWGRERETHEVKTQKRTRVYSDTYNSDKLFYTTEGFHEQR